MMARIELFIPHVLRWAAVISTQNDNGNEDTD